MSTIVNSKVLAQSLKALFIEGWKNTAAPAELAKFITKTTSNGRKDSYGWLGQAPNMTEWLDERKIKALNEFAYEIPNKNYEATLGVDANDVEDDNLGAIKMRINDLVAKGKLSHPRSLFFKALMEGETALCYDGQPFFSTSHSEGNSGVQSNLITGTGVTMVQLQADIDKAIAAMKGFKDDQGDLINEGDLEIHAIVPLALEGAFKQLNTADVINNNTNVHKGLFASVMGSGRLTDANDYYLFNTAAGVQAFIHQMRKEVTFNSLQEESERGFMRRQYFYGIDSREGFGYGLWQKAVKVKNA